jgi:hypothetical protein
MASYAIGDIQGCFYSFQNLLSSLSFNDDKDQLWLTGDLVNRGRGSLEVTTGLFEVTVGSTVVSSSLSSLPITGCESVL